ncbi:hypothetical protein BC834DRAFT_648831 [Gloeopeniophorella convolvens]|nr:hypothetical protein BC834DRAFT_648831 [Gloeopeniophorella convolvens]
MFRNIARASLRRGLHTARPVSVSAGFSRHRLAMAAGASVAAAAYLGWRMTTDNQAIALDSDTSAPRATETTGHPSTSEPSGSSPVSPSENPEQEQQLSDATEGIPSEEEAASQGAFDPVTGKINWDCPCLGGMAYGPCGMQFREAFSCFVFSEEEPKGIDCVEKFKAMQDCFKENPDVYGEGK